jgi:hypothetical protein
MSATTDNKSQGLWGPPAAKSHGLWGAGDFWAQQVDSRKEYTVKSQGLWGRKLRLKGHVFSLDAMTLYAYNRSLKGAAHA